MNKIIAIICTLIAGFGSISAETRYKGDINNDGKVDLADMVALATAINEGKTDKNLHDLNASGSIDDTDLQILADIILSEKLVEDTGFNIGIGGWDDGGEDFGGEVFSTGPTGSVLSRASEPSFFISDPLYDLDLSRQYVNIGIASPEQICGALFEIRLINDALSYDIANDLILNSVGGTLDGHIFYGKPLIIKDKDDDYWNRLRFIVFSPALKPFQATDGAMVKLYFTGSSDYSVGQFKNCQTIAANATAATYHPTSDFSKDWTRIPVTKIEISNQQPLEIAQGQSVQLNISILPACASDPNVSYTSENYNIAYVDQSGNITANSAGETTITITANDGSGISVSIPIKVNPILVSSITLSETNLDLTIGDTNALAASISPENATNKDVSWSSANPQVATVDEYGNVTAVAAGETTITVTANDGSGCSASCNVTVSAAVVLVESINLDYTTLELNPGDVHQLNATILPENATDKTILWWSDDKNIADVDQNGLVTMSNNGGTTTIHVRACDGSEVEATCTVTGMSGIDEIIADAKEMDIYNVYGQLLKAKASPEYLNQLAPGFYIIVTPGKTFKYLK